MGQGFEIEETNDLRDAAADYQDQAGRTRTDASWFDAMARLDPDVWGNTSASWKMANNYEEFFNQVLKDLREPEGIADSLDKLSKALRKIADHYDELERANTITVRPGDSLSAIARQTLGNGNRWPEVAANNPQITDPNHIHPGDQVRIPRPPQ